MRLQRSLLLLSLVFFICSLIACGSGGSTSTSATTPPSPAPPASGSQSPGGSGNGSGSSGSAASPLSALAFVSAGSQIYGIAVDSSNNVSTTPGSPYTVAGQMTWLASSGQFLFAVAADAANPSSDNITSYRSDANGSLTKIQNVVAKGAHALATESSGKFLYATADTDASNLGVSAPAIYGYAVDQSSGTLSALPGSPWQINHGQAAADLQVTPNGAYICVNMVLPKANEAVQCYPRHSDGTIDPGPNYITPISTNTNIPGFAVTPDSAHVLSTDGDSLVHSSLIGFPPSNLQTTTGGRYTNGIAVYPFEWAAVTNRDSGTVSIIEIGSNASMAGGPSTPAGNEPNQVAFSSSGIKQFNYLFVSTKDGTLVFSFDPNNAALKPLNAGNPVPGSGVLATMNLGRP